MKPPSSFESNPPRHPRRMRPVYLQKDVSKFTDASVLFCQGDTQVLCSIRLQHQTPRWMNNNDQGWVTADYSMIPASAPQRQRRDRFGYIDKRSLEIERLIGRALRAVVDLELIGPRTLQVDCEVLQADGGTRTASITGSWIALEDIFSTMQEEEMIVQQPLKEPLAGISAGFLKDQAWLDLDYKRDKNADVDLNVAMSQSGTIAELQGTGEEHLFSRDQFDYLMELVESGIDILTDLQQQAMSQDTVTWQPDDHHLEPDQESDRK